MSLEICIPRAIIVWTAFIFHQLYHTTDCLLFSIHPQKTIFSNHHILIVKPRQSSLSEYDIATEDISKLNLRLRVGPSQVVPNQLGLYLESSFHSDTQDPNVHVIQGTPICRYATGYFTNDCKSDKSVGYLFEGSGVDSNTDLVMYQDQIMTLHSALHSFYIHRKIIPKHHETEEKNNKRLDLLWGHEITIHSPQPWNIHISPQRNFTSWIFEPFDFNNPNPIESSFSPLAPTELGKFANDLAFDPTHDGVQSYEASSKERNQLKLVWKLEEVCVWNTNTYSDSTCVVKPVEQEKILVPVWPMVIAKYDFIIRRHTEPTEIGLEYGYHYWQAYLQKEESTKQE